MNSVDIEIRGIVDRETSAWDSQDVELLLSIFHPDMVWPWPKRNCDHDPMNWVMVMGKFNYQRWEKFFREFFQKNTLVHDTRDTRRIRVSQEGDGAFAVVDIDTLWVDTDGNRDHWIGRVCKVYAKTEDGWKMTMHTGVLTY